MIHNKIENITSKVSFLQKIFIWSIIFESLLFFIIGSQTSTGFSMTVGKMLQLVVFVLLLVKLFCRAPGDFKIPNFSHPLYRYFVVFFVLAVLAAVIGGFSGGYTLITKYNAEYADTIIAKIVRSSTFRPVLEYIILIYYFVYFIILPKYIINNVQSLFYFFRFFRIAFISCLVLGFSDLFFQLLGVSALPRDIWEGRMVGFRFHGIAGEPRDAFVYLFFGFGVMNLREYCLRGHLLGFKWFAIVLLGALLTQSGSGLTGIVFALCLYFANSVGTFSLKKILMLFGLLIFGAGIIALSIYSSQRLQDYIEISSVVLETLKAGDAPPPLFAPQMVNIFPLWDIFSKFISGNLLPVFFGSGFGSASVVNNNLGKGLWNELTNPHSQLIRLLYECGIIGTIVYIKSFLYPIKKMATFFPKSIKQFFFIISLVILGLNLSHRSTTMFIYLGIFMATYMVIQKPVSTSKV